MRKAFKAFTYPDFRLMWAGAFMSSVGTWMQEVAQNWLILTMTGSAFLLGLDAFLGDAPFLVFSLFGGVLADRVDRRKILLRSQYVQMGSAALLAVLLLAGAVQVWMILTLSFVVGLAQSFGGPAYQALVPTLVDRKDLPNAVALNSIQFNLARVIGPVLAGIAFYKFGAATCFGLNALSFLAPIAALWFLTGGGGVVKPTEGVLASLKTGLAAAWDAKALRGLIVLSFIGSFCAMPLVTFLPIFARNVFHGDAKGYSVLLACFGVGAIVGSLLVANLVKRFRRSSMVTVAMAVVAALVPVHQYAPGWVTAALIIFVMGSCVALIQSVLGAVVQRDASPEHRGRILSWYQGFNGLAYGIGLLTLGFTADQFGLRTTFAVSGCLTAVLLILSRRSAGWAAAIDGVDGELLDGTVQPSGSTDVPLGYAAAAVS